MPASDDASDMYTLDVFSIWGVPVRPRTSRDHPANRDQLYIHIDAESRPPIDLVVEVANGGKVHHQL